MNETINTAIEVSTWVVQGLANIAIQSMVVILIGLIAARLMRKYGSAVQSTIYRATVVAVLVCPFASLAMKSCGVSGWSLKLPPATSVVADQQSVAVTSDGAAPQVETDLSVSAESELPLADSAENENPRLAQPVPTSSSVSPAFPPRAHLLAESHRASITSSHDRGEVQQHHSKRSRVVAMIYVLSVVIWGSGAAFLLIRLFLAHRRMSRLLARTLKADQSEVALCRRLAKQLQVSVPTVHRSPLLSSPCLTGVRSPAILLPIEITDKTLLEKAVVHELAHLGRRDPVWNGVQRVALALFFFQPLLWWLVRRLETTAEEVCDDYVVRYCTDRAGYAKQLVDLAESNLLAPGLAGLGMFSRKSLLGHRVIRILDTTRTLSTRTSLPMIAGIVVLALVCGALSSLLGSHSYPAWARLIENSEEASSTDSERNPATHPHADTEQVSFGGTVVDLTGKPVTGARVSHGDTVTTSRADGSFSIDLPKSVVDENGDGMPFVTITKTGYGFSLGRLNPQAKHQQLTLVNDNHPVMGKLIDLEGNAIAGAKVEVRMVTHFEHGVLRSHLSRAITDGGKLGAMPQGLGLGVSQIPTAITDAEGRFTIRGIGSGRLVQLTISGETTAIRRVLVATTDQPDVTYREPRANFLDDGIIHCRRPVLTCEPSQPIEGIVVDRETKKPLPGFSVTSYGFLNQGRNHLVGQDDLKARTDENGRFRLTGMPKGKGNQILVTAPVSGEFAAPYITEMFEVGDAQGLAPVEMELGLQRGIWIRGQVVDRTSGKPLPHAHLQYLPYEDNEAAAKIDIGSQQLIEQGWGPRTNENGEFKFVSVPGPAAIGVTTPSLPQYPVGQGLSAVPADRRPGGKIGALGYYQLRFHRWTRIKFVDVPPQGLHDLKFELTTGKTVRFKAVDANGDPVSGVNVAYLPALVQNNFKTKAPEFTISGFLPGQKRLLTLRHNEKKIGAIVSIDADDQPVHVVKLQPFATVRAKLIDGQGKPAVGAELTFELLDESGSMVLGAQPTGAAGNRASDEKGNFQHTLIPGNYAYSFQQFNGFSGYKKVVILPGQDLDLGTLDLSKKLNEDSNEFSSPQPGRRAKDE